MHRGTWVEALTGRSPEVRPAVGEDELRQAPSFSANLSVRATERKTTAFNWLVASLSVK